MLLSNQLFSTSKVARDDVPSSSTLSDSVDEGDPCSALSERAFELGMSNLATLVCEFQKK